MPPDTLRSTPGGAVPSSLRFDATSRRDRGLQFTPQRLRSVGWRVTGEFVSIRAHLRHEIHFVFFALFC